MRFGVREICDVVLRAKAIQKIGNKVFYKDEPVLYFDSLKTSSLEGAATTVYAQGGRGNSRLIAWEGERTVTFTMEDALISPAGFSILSGAGLVSADNNNKIKVHTTERTVDIEFVKAGDSYYDNGGVSYEQVIVDEEWEPTDGVDYYANVTPTASEPTYVKGTVVYLSSSYVIKANGITYENFYTKTLTEEEAVKDMLMVYISQEPYYIKAGNYKANYIYVMRVYNDEIVTEPFIPTKEDIKQMDENSPYTGKWRLIIADDDNEQYTADLAKGWCHHEDPEDDTTPLILDDDCVAFVDYYVEKAGVQQIDITPDKFGGNYYLEASTLFRDTNGVDLPAEFIIPNCKIQSNFTFSMASSGDPSTFTFTMDAFPDYTRFDPTKKVLASIQILDASSAAGLDDRSVTGGEWTIGTGEGVAVRDKTWSGKQPK